eukprot:m.231054 g.231054  ORF g.231054 m.231054 type:complete len:311 (-) comp18227_c0_seq1:70-1002(-)
MLLLALIALTGVFAAPYPGAHHGHHHGNHSMMGLERGGQDARARVNAVFDVQHAKDVLQYAFAAYCSAGSLASWNCGYCRATSSSTRFVTTVTDSLTSTFSYIAFDPSKNTVYVSFRGTVNIPNWMTDFDFIKVHDIIDDPSAEVHAGFYNAYTRVRQGILNSVKQVVTSSCVSCTHIIVTGHSLGAALSGLCAVDLKVVLGSRYLIEVTNFGMPRLGNAAFASDFPKFVDIAFRMVHEKDLVPHVPPSSAGFHHIATEVWSRGEGAPSNLKYIVCNGSGEDPSCSDSIPANQFTTADHDIYMGETNSQC